MHNARTRVNERVESMVSPKSALWPRSTLNTEVYASPERDTMRIAYGAQQRNILKVTKSFNLISFGVNNMIKHIYISYNKQ